MKSIVLVLPLCLAGCGPEVPVSPSERLKAPGDHERVLKDALTSWVIAHEDREKIAGLVQRSALPIRISLAGNVIRPNKENQVILPVIVTNDSDQEIVTSVTHEGGGGIWRRTDLLARVWLHGQPRYERWFCPLYLEGPVEGSGGNGWNGHWDESISAKKVVRYSVRLDYGGTGSQPLRPPLLAPGDSGAGEIQFLFIFRAKGSKERLYVTSDPFSFELNKK